MRTMKTLKMIVGLALITVITITSCKKESNNPSSTSLEFKMQATNKSTSLLKAVAMLATSGLTWDTCFINVSKIDFEAEKRGNEQSHDSSEIHIEWNGPKKIDLFSLTSVIGDISLQPGIYDEISIKINALKADAGASPVFYLAGTYTNNVNSVIPIEVIINDNFEFKVKKEGSILDATNDYTNLINLNLTMLMSGITASGLNTATLTNGKIIISSSSNVSLYNKINTNFSSCAETDFEIKKHSGSNSENGNSSGSGNGY